MSFFREHNVGQGSSGKAERMDTRGHGCPTSMCTEATHGPQDLTTVPPSTNLSTQSPCKTGEGLQPPQLLLCQRQRKQLAHPRQLCRKGYTLACASAGKLHPFGIRQY